MGNADRSDRVVIALDRLVLWSRRNLTLPVSATQLTTLETLHRDGPLRVTDLASREHLTQPGMTILLNRLEAENLARRRGDPSDRRATLVEITPAGIQQIEERHQARRAIFAARLAHLSPAQQSALIAAVEAIEAIADAPVRASGSGS